MAIEGVKTVAILTLTGISVGFEDCFFVFHRQKYSSEELMGNEPSLMRARSLNNK
jgi:hypothetical protein